MKLALAICLASLTVRADAITDQLAVAKRPELPAVAARIVKSTPAARPVILRWVASHHPASLEAVTRTIAENRPPVTPGNDHGQRPTVPPGQRYATP